VAFFVVSLKKICTFHFFVVSLHDFLQ